jgi:hypothetical protein
LVEESEGTKKLRDLKWYAVHSEKEKDLYHLIDFVEVVGTKCGYSLNQKMTIYYEIPEGKILCKDCEEGKIDWSKAK